MEKAKTLEIYTLGKFDLRRGSVSLTEDSNTDNKVWRLLKYLITFNDSWVAQEELLQELKLNRNADPDSSLAALIYRLRKRLAAFLGPEGKKYVQTRGRSYAFNTQSDYWLDAEVFKELCRETENCVMEDKDGCEELFERALELYEGDYLEETGSERWVWSARQHYKNILLTTLRLLAVYMKKRSQYEKLWQFYEKISHLIKYDERLLVDSIEILLLAERTGLAYQKYREAIQLFQDNDLLIPPELKELKSRFPSRTSEDPRPLLEEMGRHNKSRGAFVCDPETFTSLYDLELRRAVREQKDRYIVHLHLQSDEPDDILNKSGDNLLELLSHHLRSGDIVCRWHQLHFVLMLVDIEKEAVEKILQRIENSFRALYRTPEWIGIETSISRIERPDL